MVLLCPHCGSDRLVPLTFDIIEADEVVELYPSAVLGRPIMKCVGCGRRLVGIEIVRVPSEPA